jgi:hypothetical protein
VRRDADDACHLRGGDNRFAHRRGAASQRRLRADRQERCVLRDRIDHVRGRSREHHARSVAAGKMGGIHKKVRSRQSPVVSQGSLTFAMSYNSLRSRQASRSPEGRRLKYHS